MMVEIEVGDRCYELDVTHYSAETPPSRWDPGDGAEVELGNIVKVWAASEQPLVDTYTDYITFGVFLLEYAATCDCSMEEAERAIHAEADEQVRSQLQDAYEESRMSWRARDY